MYAVKLAYPISKGKALLMRLLQSVAFHIVSTSKLKYVFRLVESMSHVIGQNSLAPLRVNKTH